MILPRPTTNEIITYKSTKTFTFEALLQVSHSRVQSKNYLYNVSANVLVHLAWDSD